MMKTTIATKLAAALTLVVALAATTFAQSALLNVSYDPTRELYQQFNAAFVTYWQAKTGQKIAVRQSHA